MCRALLLLPIAALLVFIPALTAAPETRPTDAQIADILKSMRIERENFKPEKLSALGVPGLAAVLDQLMPETIAVPTTQSALDPIQAKARALAPSLAASNPDARDLAADAIIALGPATLPVVRPLVKDALTAPARAEALRIVSSLEEGLGPTYLDRHSLAMKVFTQQVHDAPRLILLVDRLMVAVTRGLEVESGRLRFLQNVAAGIAASRDDAVIDRFAPLLLHEDPRVARRVLSLVCSQKPKDFCPRLLIVALKSDRKEILSSAIRWANETESPAHAEQLHTLIRHIFDTASDTVKTDAAGYLFQHYGEKDAMGLLVVQSADKDSEIAQAAIFKLSQIKKTNDEPPADVLNTLVKAASTADDNDTRINAIFALATYSNPEAVRALIPFLSNPQADIARQTAEALRERQRDLPMLRAELTTAWRTSADPKVRDAAKSLLDQLNK